MFKLEYGSLNFAGSGDDEMVRRDLEVTQRMAL